ncbi:MAG: Fe-S-containing hydro-lyase [Planctomycetes bacterium]|nr:Fe-S-containing hydro-lyase [Planctomycetota bacterium]MCK5578263.1 Fe-S-containing hydro-lyase [Planctomycetota bacterium]
MNKDTALALRTPLTDEVLAELKIGDKVKLSGVVYTARDAAHRRLAELLNKNQIAQLPFDPQGQVIYYVGPTPAKPGQIIGSAGPTTSFRMDAYTPQLLAAGLKATIGKGARSPEVLAAMKKYRAVYLVAVGGAGALLSQCIKKAEVIAYDDLGPEAIRKLEVVDLPLTVANDIQGNDLYQEGIKKYAIA